MTADHPTIDTIADYHAGLLQPPHHESVAAHLSRCADCTAALDAVGEVSTVLAEAGGGVVSMPDDVAHRLDEALRRAAGERADADRSGAVVPLERPAAAGAPSGGRRRSWPLLAAAAAVLVVVGTAVVGDLDLSPGPSADSSVAGRAAPEDASVDAAVDGEDEQPGAASESAGGQLESEPPVPKQRRLAALSAASLPQYAESLTGPEQSSGSLAPASEGCAEVPAPADDVVSVARWQGSPAVVVVDPQARTATVFDCETASEVLFRTGY